MARFAFRGSPQRMFSLAVTCILAFACFHTPIAVAQVRHPAGAHANIGMRTVPPPHVFPPRAFVPPVSRPIILQPRFIAGPHLAGAPVGFRFPRRPIVFPHRFFFAAPFVSAPFFQFGVGLGFTTLWWPNCSPYWAFGYYCTGLPPISSGFESYLTAQPYQPPVYAYGPEQQPLVWLYLKNGAVYSVTDYWFVSGQVHFIAIEEGGAKSAEQTIALTELDAQKTAFVNTRRGFRVVMRDEPLDQYMRDRPNAIPPLLDPSQKN